MDNAVIVFTLDKNGDAQPFPHFWEHTVGSDHATMALRADWQQQMARCHKELGFKHVRFHGLLSDDMGTMMRENDQDVYSFFNTDQIWDFLLSIGMRPFVELSFMPTTLASGGDIVFHYKGNITPPRDVNEWNFFIEKLVRHWMERYGVDEVKEWFFEVWNEPNLDAFWKGTQQQYFSFYENTANTIKKVSPLLKVGGPATADNEWIAEFVDYCEKHNAPVDFISTHHYPTDSFGKPGDDTITQLSESERSVLRKEAAEVKAKAKGKPVYYTEWCTSSNPFDELHDQPYAAAYIIKTVIEAQGLVEGYSYWTFSDIFEENYFSSIPFHGGFGLLNIYGIPKPAYRAFQLLHGIGDKQLTVSGQHETVDVWAFTGDGETRIIAVNSALPRHDIKTETVRIELGTAMNGGTASVCYIDDNNANAPKVWQDMGKPDSLLPAQVAQLEQASALVYKEAEIQNKDGKIFMEITLQPQASACIVIAL